MLERKRLEVEEGVRGQSVTSQIEAGISDGDVHIGPSDHVPWLDDRKWAFIRLEGRNFGDVPLTVELKLEVHDSPNSAGVIIDAVRCAKLAQDQGIGGPVGPACQCAMKSPPPQLHDDEGAGRLRRPSPAPYRRPAGTPRAAGPATAMSSRRRVRTRGMRVDLDRYTQRPAAPSPRAWTSTTPGPSTTRLRCLRYMHDVEHHTICYLRDLWLPGPPQPRVTTFLTLWSYEEIWHGEAIVRVLVAHGEDTGADRRHAQPAGMA